MISYLFRPNRMNSGARVWFASPPRRDLRGRRFDDGSGFNSGSPRTRLRRSSCASRQLGDHPEPTPSVSSRCDSLPASDTCHSACPQNSFPIAKKLASSLAPHEVTNHAMEHATILHPDYCKYWQPGNAATLPAKAWGQQGNTEFPPILCNQAISHYPKPPATLRKKSGTATMRQLPKPKVPLLRETAPNPRSKSWFRGLQPSHSFCTKQLSVRTLAWIGRRLFLQQPLFHQQFTVFL